MAAINRVGTVVPNEEQLSQYLASCKALYEILQPWCIMLEPDQRSGMARARSGANDMIDLVRQLAQEAGLSVQGLSLDNMAADIKVAAAAGKVERELEHTLQLASDTRFAAQGEAWQAFLAYYGILQTMAEHNPELAEKLKPVVAFMSTGSRRKPTP